jgi:hypothetical protein
MELRSVYYFVHAIESESESKHKAYPVIFYLKKKYPVIFATVFLVNLDYSLYKYGPAMENYLRLKLNTTMIITNEKPSTAFSL